MSREFPDLSPESSEILEAANWDNDDDTRRGVAAVLNALAGQFNPRGCFLVTRSRIEKLALNFHTPPPRPTLAEAREAARQLGGPSAEIVHQFLATLEQAA